MTKKELAKALPPKCYTMNEFCEVHRISRNTYYKMREDGTAPVEFKIGESWLITEESAADWRAAQDQKAKAARHG